MALSKKKLSESEVSVEIDLEKLLGRAARDKGAREVFFQLAFDKLSERLDKGLDANGKKMAAYSRKYKSSLAFEVFEKNNTVNMQLTGDMINDITELDSSKDKLKIGFQSDFSNLKAYANITGDRGSNKAAPAREFFGWSDKELKAIADEIKPSIKEDPILNDAKILAFLTRFS